ncbi:MAG TPA: response regulator [Mucilaginibacter sp.]
MCDNLFYIDDNEFDHLIVSSLVKTYTDCKRIKFFFNGRDALDLLKENELNANELPDIILVDLFMPGFTGWDFLDGFTKIYPALCKKIKVYILSSSIKNEDIEKSKDYAFVQSYITKPLTQGLIKNFNNLN